MFFASLVDAFLGLSSPSFLIARWTYYCPEWLMTDGWPSTCLLACSFFPSGEGVETKKPGITQTETGYWAPARGTENLNQVQKNPNGNLEPGPYTGY